MRLSKKFIKSLCARMNRDEYFIEKVHRNAYVLHLYTSKAKQIYFDDVIDELRPLWTHVAHLSCGKTLVSIKK